MLTVFEFPAGRILTSVRNWEQEAAGIHTIVVNNFKRCSSCRLNATTLVHYGVPMQCIIPTLKNNFALPICAEKACRELATLRLVNIRRDALLIVATRELTTPETVDKACAYCASRRFSKEQKLLTCSGCNGVRYCDSSCQEKHWAVHGKECARVDKVSE